MNFATFAIILIAALIMILFTLTLLDLKSFDEQREDYTINFITDVRVKSNPYLLSEDDVKQVQNVIISQNKCANHETPIFVLSTAKITGKYFNRRKAIRETWGKEAYGMNMKVLFVLGISANNHTNEKLLEESLRFNDMLQFDFDDNYQTVTLKTIAIINWTRYNCMSCDYIIKLDDDVVLNIQRLNTLINEKVFKSGITGRMLFNSRPYRRNYGREGRKWYLPETVYPENSFPPYVDGPAYVISTDIIGELYNSAINYSMPAIYLEDMYITGISAQNVNINRFDSKEFNNRGVSVCEFFNVTTFHGDDIDLKAYWTSWKSTDFRMCLFFSYFKVFVIVLFIAFIIILIIKHKSRLKLIV